VRRGEREAPEPHETPVSGLTPRQGGRGTGRRNTRLKTASSVAPPPWSDHLRWLAGARWMPRQAARPAILPVRFPVSVLPYDLTVGE
jgi:hypothetical protein